MTAACWDTSLLSRLRAENAAMLELAERAAAGDPVLIAAPALLESAYGHELAARSDARFARWLAWLDQLVTRRLIAVVPLDGRGALVAGRLRARMPHAPAPARGDRRSKTMRQAAWLLDLQIAATAFAAGFDLATKNVADFDRISALLADMFPQARPLGVSDRAV